MFVKRNAKDFFEKKIYLLVTALIGISFALGMRLFYLQVTCADQLFKQSLYNFTRYENTNSLRGEIVDCHGTLLATNSPVTNVYWQGTGNKKLTPEQIRDVTTLCTLFNLAIDEKELAYAERFGKKIKLFSDIPFERLSTLIELFPHHPNIMLENNFKRLYPYKECAGQILGYLTTIETGYEGTTGLEKICNDELRGEPGSIMRVINSFGLPLQEKVLKPTLKGNRIQTTLDFELQTIAEEIFPQEYTGVMIIMDPKDGAIKTLVSRPSFDPNLFVNGISKEDWNMLKDKKPFLNRACQSLYPPGSIFKLITLTSLLETGLITPESKFYCRGRTFLGRDYRCHKQEGHGPLNPAQSLVQSCNIMFYELAKKMDIDTLAHYAKKFGLGESTASIFKENTGLVPSRAWKRKVKGERWWQGETLSAAIGQSYLLVTPLQVARMVGAIETGYLVNPRILEESPIIHEPLGIRPETRQFLKRAMHSVAEEGTARRLYYPSQFRIEAKTSTAQTSALENKELGTKHWEHGWLAANICHKDGTPLTFVVLIEHAGSSSISVALAKQFLRRYVQLLKNKQPSPPHA